MVQINKIKSEIVEITTDISDIQKIIKEYYEELYANELDNLKEMDKVSETYNLPKLIQEEIDNLKRLTTRNEIEFVTKKILLANKCPGLNSLTGKFY